MPALRHPDPPLSDGTIVLRRHHPRDAPAIAAACQDPEIPRWTTVPSPYSLADAEGWIASVPDSAASGMALDMVVVDAADDRVLGAVGLVGIDAASGMAEIGYWLAPEARGQGVMTRAVVLLRDWAAQALGFSALELFAHEDNLASRRVAERAGFTATPVRSPRPRDPAAVSRDHVRYVWRAPSVA